MSLLSPLKIEIPHEAPTSTLPEALRERLCHSPNSKTPAELAEALEKHAERTSSLRKAHLDAVKDRATRDIQRAEEAAQRKRRLAAAQIERVQRKLAFADVKVAHKLEVKEAKAQADKALRLERAQNVAAARAAAEAVTASRASELRAAEAVAASKHSKLIAAVHDKSAHNVKHAMEVVAAHKEKLAADTEAASERLGARLSAAESRREGLSSPPKVAPAGVFSRVLNEAAIEAAKKDKAFRAKMERAATKREAVLAERVGRAHEITDKASEVAAAGKSKADGTDAATKADKAAMFGKLAAAEVARQLNMKQRAASGLHPRGDTTSVIVVRVDKGTPRTPPPALVKRLTTPSTKLTATAKARQQGAASRRQLAAAKALLKSAGANGRRAAALQRVGAKSAALTAELKARAARALINKAVRDGRRAHALLQEAQHATAAAKTRVADDAKVASRAAELRKAEAAAAERHAAKLRKVAKKGVVAVRSSAVQSRRAALLKAVVARGAEHTARFERAIAAKEALIAEAIARAKRSQTPLRAKAAAEKEAEPSVEAA